VAAPVAAQYGRDATDFIPGTQSRASLGAVHRIGQVQTQLLMIIDRNGFGGLNDREGHS
jgi:hypothetical protein